jgi:O-antigen/teichoic acid export membrane protein
VLARLGDLTSGRLLARNVVLNLFGWAVPALVALAAIPHLVHTLGSDRFGLLALAWSLIGYASLLDLGVGRALTQVLADRFGHMGEDESPAITWTAHWLLLPVGLGSAALLAGLAPMLAYRVLNVPPALQAETVTALRVLAVALPCLVLTAGLRAVLEAAQQFRVINALRIPLGIATYLGPVAVLPFSRSLVALVGVLAVARSTLFLLHVYVVLRRFPSLRRPRLPSVGAFNALWGVAGWITLSSIISPMMVSADRFVIGAVLPMAAVMHYTTSSEIATKLWLFTAALQPVIFPAIAATFARAPMRTAMLFDRAIRVTALALLPPTLLVALFAPEALRVWLGPEFASQGVLVLQGLVLATFVNCFGQAAYAVLQGAGRADIPGRLHIVELPLYIGLLWLLLHRFGIVGVALAWGARMLGDTLAQLTATASVLPEARAASRRATAIVLLSTSTLLLLLLIGPFVWRVLAAVIGLAAFAVIGWTVLISPAERDHARAILASLRARSATMPAHADAGD